MRPPCYEGRIRVLHTSAWHLGKSLAGISRQSEHEAFCDAAVDLCEKSEVDVVLLAGDVFDTYNPPIAAEELFFDTLARLGDGGRRAVVVIAGDHDSPDRLTTAVPPLADRHGVWILGHPGGMPRPTAPQARGPCPAPGRGPQRPAPRAPQQRRGADLRPPRPQRGPLPPSAHRQPRRARAPADLLQARRRAPRRAAPQRTGAGLPARRISPRRPQLHAIGVRAGAGGRAYQIDARHLPAATQYKALGHLHLAQRIPDAPSHAAYAGAPLAFRMSEREHDRSHRLISLSDPRATPELEAVPVAAGRPLVVWEAESVEEVMAGVEAGAHEGAIIELRLAVDRRLDHAAMARLQKLPRSFLRIRVEFPEAVPPEVRHQLPASELFQALYREQTGLEPDPEFVALFVELLGTDAPATPLPRSARPAPAP